MKKRIYILLLLLLSLIGVLPASAQIVDAQGQYVDTVFNDNVDRTAEDFVISSLLVADPGTVLYSVLGHACIRLQCPAFGLDYCFSYESEDASQKVLSFLAGKLLMGLFAIPVEEYCEFYRNEGRGVYEYTLNLPIEVKQELWRVVDEQLARGIRLPYDYYRKNCATSSVDFLNEALGSNKIVYDKSLRENPHTAREMYFLYTTPQSWTRFVSVFIAGSATDILHYNDRQLIVPMALVHAWQKATVNGKPLIANEPVVLVEGKPQVSDGWFTPMFLAIILLVLSIINLWIKYPYFDWMMLVAQTLIGCGMTYLICFSDLCCTEWNWLIIPFNPLPVICWKWRKYWALPDAGLLTVWCIAMTTISFWGHVRVDWSHIVIVLAFIIILLKQSNILSRLFNKFRVKNIEI